VRLSVFHMVEILCPHCNGEIELPDGEYGEFSCPLCEENFIWEDESGHGDVSLIESENPSWYKFVGIAVIIVIFLIVMLLSPVISSIGETDTGSWPVEQVEIVEITNEGHRNVGSSDSDHREVYYAVEIRFMYENDERQWTLKCDAERDAEGYVEDNPVGSIIDIRANPTKGESPFFEIEGGCPYQSVPIAEIVGGVVCFGLIMAFIVLDKLITK
jgi:predicted RNA-binding Zn-ribbon protein involved in translation (DUF1610 family)